MHQIIHMNGPEGQNTDIYHLHSIPVSICWWRPGDTIESFKTANKWTSWWDHSPDCLHCDRLLEHKWDYCPFPWRWRTRTWNFNDPVRKLWVICSRMERNKRMYSNCVWTSKPAVCLQMRNFQRLETSTSGLQQLFLSALCLPRLLDWWCISLHCSIQFTMKQHNSVKVQHLKPQLCVGASETSGLLFSGCSLEMLVSVWLLRVQKDPLRLWGSQTAKPEEEDYLTSKFYHSSNIKMMKIHVFCFFHLLHVF